MTTTLDASGQPYVAVSDRSPAPLLGAFVLLFAIAVVVVGGIKGTRADRPGPRAHDRLHPEGVPAARDRGLCTGAAGRGHRDGRDRHHHPPDRRLVTRQRCGDPRDVRLARSVRAARRRGDRPRIVHLLGGILDLAFLQTSDGNGLDLRGLLLGAFILGAVGVLDDVTVTQAKLIEQLEEHGAHGAGLIRSGFDVGRSHIAATVNTLFLAYVGAGLPLLVTIIVSNQPAALVLNSEEVDVEVIRTLVGSMESSPRSRSRRSWPPSCSIAPEATGRTSSPAAVVLLASESRPGSSRSHSRRQRSCHWARAELPSPRSSSVHRPPRARERSGPSDNQSPPDNAPIPTDEPVASEPGASEPAANPDIVSEGSPYVISIGGDSLEITVTSIAHRTTTSGRRLTIDVRYRNDGPDPFDVDPSAWSLITSRGEDVALQLPPSGGLEAGDLAAGSTRSGHLEATVRDKITNTFITFTDPDGTVRFAVPADGS